MSKQFYYYSHKYYNTQYEAIVSMDKYELGATAKLIKWVTNPDNNTDTEMWIVGDLSRYTPLTDEKKLELL